MGKLCLFAALFIMLSFCAPGYAADTGQADMQPAAPGKTNPDITAETLIKAEPDVKTPASGPTIAPYKSNPIAVKAVDNSIYLFSDRIRERFSLYLSRSGKYLELMKEILKSKNIPEDMVFLSLIESGFNPYAYSVARAVGPWQFISSTAKRYGLVIDWWKDERRDPVKSTEAAANYLKDLYKMFGSWNLAMAAYNAGEGKILRALHRSKSDDYWSLLKTRHIRSETKNYVPHFIAASMIAVNPEEFGFKNIEYHQPLDYDEATVTGPLDLEVAARCADTTTEVIKELNPELRRWCTPPDMPVYILRIPAGSKEIFLKNLADTPEEERFTVETYTVKKGDTIDRIAKKAGVTVRAILVLNSMDKVKPLKPGAQISLPPKEKFELDRDDRFEIRKVSY
ncbi:MAG: transglycosylase SLT domain-containing protein, partial [Nitrospirota bacterium]